jgi:hypothetical protein
MSVPDARRVRGCLRFEGHGLYGGGTAQGWMAGESVYWGMCTPGRNEGSCCGNRATK